jgi:hypothetical protein
MILTPYITVEDAETYFSGRLNSDAWDDSTDQEKLKALITATRRIDSLNYIGVKANALQDLEFPRLGQSIVPDDIKDACCELALVLLDSVDPNMEVSSIAYESKGYSSVKGNYNRSFVLDHIRAGIPSLEAWQLLCKYLVDPKRVIIRRSN